MASAMARCQAESGTPEGRHMNNFEKRFVVNESGEREFRYRTESGPSPATWSGLREFDLIMTWSCPLERATTPRLMLDGDHIYWSSN